MLMFRTSTLQASRRKKCAMLTSRTSTLQASSRGCGRGTEAAGEARTRAHSSAAPSSDTEGSEALSGAGAADEESGDAADACCPPDARGAAGTGPAYLDRRVDGWGSG